MDDLTIEQLATATSMTVRNIRNHQSRGLLPGPQVRGRVGYYGPRHVERLQLIRRLQEDGLALKAITAMLEPGDDEPGHVARLRRAVFDPSVAPPEVSSMTYDELAEEFGEEAAAFLPRAEAHGVLRRVAEDRWDVVQPAMLEAARESVRQGMSLDRSIAASEQAAPFADGAAAVYVKAAIDEIWAPFVAAGQPADQLAHITEAIVALQHVTIDAFAELFHRALTHEIERSLGLDAADQPTA
ncbi:MAG: MerR family transcriptional regulator [Patulibacter sp.]|nr:MerR family transcriptional regulator [Patulibacter sp.]